MENKKLDCEYKRQFLRWNRDRKLNDKLEKMMYSIICFVIGYLFGVFA